MVLTPEIVGQFIDAAVTDQSLAEDLLRQHPDLQSATWLGESLLRFLAIENYPVGVRFLAERGWAIEERDAQGTTPLHDAVRASAYDAVRVLLELGANPNAQSELYDRPLDGAIAAQDTPMIQILLDGGAHPTDPSAPEE